MPKVQQFKRAEFIDSLPIVPVSVVNRNVSVSNRNKNSNVINDSDCSNHDICLIVGIHLFSIYVIGTYRVIKAYESHYKCELY